MEGEVTMNRNGIVVFVVCFSYPRQLLSYCMNGATCMTVSSNDDDESCD